MLYFAYGSNLHHFQMKRRCKDSVFIKRINLKNFKLTFRSKYRAADIEPKKNSVVPGGLYEISKNDEKKLDYYERFPIIYTKDFFTLKIKAELIIRASAFCPRMPPWNTSKRSPIIIAELYILLLSE